MVDKDVLLDEFAENLDSAIDNSNVAVRMIKDSAELIEWCKKRAKLALEHTIALIEESVIEDTGAKEQKDSVLNKIEIVPVYDRESILRSAAKCTTQDRNIEYGEPEDNFAAIAAEWQAHLDRRPPGPLNAHDVAIMMVGFKMVRSTNNPAHMDNYIDIAGYAACGGEIASKKTEPLDLVIG